MRRRKARQSAVALTGLRLLTKCGVQGDHPPAGVWGRVPVAQSSRRALAASAARFAPHLRVALRFAQQPTRLTLPFGAPSPYAAAFLASVASARRAQETRFSPKSGVFQRSEARQSAVALTGLLCFYGVSSFKSVISPGTSAMASSQRGPALPPVSTGAAYTIAGRFSSAGIR